MHAVTPTVSQTWRSCVEGDVGWTRNRRRVRSTLPCATRRKHGYSNSTACTGASVCRHAGIHCISRRSAYIRACYLALSYGITHRNTTSGFVTTATKSGYRSGTPALLHRVWVRTRTACHCFDIPRTLSVEGRVTRPSQTSNTNADVPLYPDTLALW